MKAVRNILTGVLAVCLFVSTPAGAKLVQHLDASVPSNVVTDGAGVVSQWNDLSGNGNHAVANRGTVLYPSTPFAAGDVGVDCGLERNDLQSFDQAGTSALLDFSGAAAGNSGFTIFVVCRVDAIGVGDQYLLGTRNTLGNFSFHIEDDGVVGCKMQSNIASGGALPAAAGDTIVLGASYEAATGNVWFWESKNDWTETATFVADGDWDSDNPFILGEAKPTANSSSFFRGAIVLQRHFRLSKCNNV